MGCAVVTMDKEERRVAWIMLVALRWRELEMRGRRSETLVPSGKCHSSMCFKNKCPRAGMTENSTASPLQAL